MGKKPLDSFTLVKFISAYIYEYVLQLCFALATMHKLMDCIQVL